MDFTTEKFLSYYSTQFKQDFDRYFCVSTLDNGFKVIDGVNSKVDLTHPSDSRIKHGAAAAIANPGMIIPAVAPDPNSSLEKDWYFAGIYGFIVLSQMSIHEKVCDGQWQRTISHSPYPLVRAILSNTSVLTILEQAHQDPCGPNYHGCYLDMMNVVVPALLPKFEQFLDSEVTVYEKADVLQSFSKHLDELLSSLSVREQ